MKKVEAYRVNIDYWSHNKRKFESKLKDNGFTITDDQDSSNYIMKDKHIIGHIVNFKYLSGAISYIIFDPSNDTPEEDVSKLKSLLDKL